MVSADEFIVLQDRIEIQETSIAYTFALDSRNWELLKNIFTEDATAIYGSDEIGLKISCSSRQEIIEMCQNSLNGCGPTQHLFSNFRINLNGNIASSVCYAQIGHVGKEPNQNEYWEIWAEYHDNWTKIDKGWRINDRKMIVTQEFGDREKVLGP
ncbi:MAG: nuclear transport factor 2 family protein [SAR86 cluster bacterium]|jgi:hypothetical protein|nr:nuclear transport factor 2 family protein [SAR86 cluster bacterium]